MFCLAFKRNLLAFIEWKDLGMNWRNNGGPTKPQRTKRSDPEECMAMQQDSTTVLQAQGPRMASHVPLGPQYRNFLIIYIVFSSSFWERPLAGFF